jgi:hypothetical protein
VTESRRELSRGMYELPPELPRGEVCMPAKGNHLLRSGVAAQGLVLA